MQVIDDYVYVHLQKSGGTSIMKMMQKQRLDDIKFLVHHLPSHATPRIYDDYKKIAMVRNPLTWYTSFYNHIIEHHTDDSNILFHINIFMENKKIVSFNKFLERALNFKDYCNESSFIDNYKLWRKNKSNHFMAFFIPDTTNFNPPDTYYQFIINGMIGSDVETYHMETQFDEVARILKLEPEYHNVSSITKRITKETQQKILEKDSILFDRFGYKKELLENYF